MLIHVENRLMVARHGWGMSEGGIKRLNVITTSKKKKPDSTA